MKCRLIGAKGSVFYKFWHLSHIRPIKNKGMGEGMSLQTGQWHNWSGGVVCQPARFEQPADEEELSAILAAARNAGQTVRVAGSGHSFSLLCATDGVVVSLNKMTGLTYVDQDAKRVRVRAGTRLRALNRALAEYGLAMENLGDIDVQSVAGALATGTHGTGAGLGSLSTQVTGMRMLLADGTSLWCDERQNAEIYRLGRVHLGALGVVTEIELTCRAAYHLRYASHRISVDDLLQQIERYKQQHRNFECYWFPFTDTVQTKVMDVTDAPASGGGAWQQFSDWVIENGAFWGLCQVARLGYRPSRAMSRIAASAVPTSERIAPAHLAYATPRAVRFQETEYSIPAEHFVEAFAEIRALFEAERIAVNFPLEIRFVAADEIPLSPACRRDSVYIAAHMYRAMPYAHYFERFAGIMGRYGGRPHWGKMHTLTAEDFAGLYPEWQQFKALRERLDPGGLFLNDHLRIVFGL